MLLVQMVQQDHKVRQAQLVRQAHRDHRATQAQLDHKVMKVLLAQLVLKAPKV